MFEEKIKVTVSEEMDGLRLDQFLSEQLTLILFMI